MERKNRKNIWIYLEKIRIFLDGDVVSVYTYFATAHFWFLSLRETSSSCPTIGEMRSQNFVLHFKLPAMGYKCNNNNTVNNEHTVILITFFVWSYVCETNQTPSSQTIYLSEK